eukprot:TRINITY_DN1254_c0_g1_i3.p1 TRINITY_DN1254_c0_g1~~TRINITY_DN1254_c0_g1_i3.p1  ORF type:complete len:614 (-),score=139.80 TRINITY_DN1254_c0_g1_i3:1365-3206(-)
MSMSISMGSSREASLSRVERKRLERIETRTKQFEDEKKLDGIYCILTALNLTNTSAGDVPVSPVQAPSSGHSNGQTESHQHNDPVRISRLASYSSTSSNIMPALQDEQGLYIPSPMSISVNEPTDPPTASAAKTVDLYPVQYVINFSGAVFGSKAKVLPGYRCINDSSVSASHFRIMFRDRQFYAYDVESKTGTYVRRNVYNYPADCSYQLQKGRTLLTGNYVLDVVECIDSKHPSYSSVQDGLLKLKIHLLGSKDERVVVVRAVEVAPASQMSLCAPADGDLSLPDLSDEVKSANEDQDDEDADMEDGQESVVKPSFESDDNSMAAQSYSSTESELDLSVFNKIMDHIHFVNGRFHVRNNPHEKLTFFSKVKRYTSRGKPSHHLSSGDVIRVGRVEFRVDIRSAPRPISDKKKEDIVCAKDMSSFELGNWLSREAMEDRHVAIDGFGKYPSDGFVGIYDGHAGRLVADFISCIFHVNLLHAINVVGKRNVECVRTAMNEAFEVSSRMIAGLGEDASYCGSTAVCGLLWKDEKIDGERHLTIGNVGDCRAFVCRDGDFLELSRSHLATAADEVSRVEEFGAKVVDGRFRGLTVTRAFGDLSLVKSGMTSTPYM